MGVVLPNIVHYNFSGRDACSLTDGDAGQDGATWTNPAMIPNFDGAPLVAAVSAFTHIYVLDGHGRDDLDTWANPCALADADATVIDQGAAFGDHNILSDVDVVTVVAPKGGFDNYSRAKRREILNGLVFERGNGARA